MELIILMEFNRENCNYLWSTIYGLIGSCAWPTHTYEYTSTSHGRPAYAFVSKFCFQCLFGQCAVSSYWFIYISGSSSTCTRDRIDDLETVFVFYSSLHYFELERLAHTAHIPFDMTTSSMSRWIYRLFFPPQTRDFLRPCGALLCVKHENPNVME